MITEHPDVVQPDMFDDVSPPTLLMAAVFAWTWGP